MKILILSDSHGEQRYMEEAIFREQPDQILHLGDRQRDGERLRANFPHIPFLAVPGNCDIGATDLPILLPEFCGCRFFVTHGHLHNVKYGLLRLSLAAREAGAQVAVFGHTHSACCERVDGLTLLNPGAAGGGRPSYGVVELTRGQTPVCRIEYL